MGRPSAIDLFAGAGGATQGLSDAGFDVVGAVEFEADAAESYRLNHPSTRLWQQDIRSLRASEMLAELRLQAGELTLLKACPPCQGFSSLAEGRSSVDDARNDLVGHTVRFVRAFRPKAVLLENVPGLARDARSFALVDALERLGYQVRQYIVDAQRFGVPQRRRRFILIAVRGRRKSVLPEQLEPLDLDALEGRVTVRSAFSELATQVNADDPLSEARVLSPVMLQRVRALPEGGSRFDLPNHLAVACHTRLEKREATAAYGRMKWDEPSPTMTTRCTSPSSGRFFHPVEDRAITLREAASLQTFPATYAFAGSRGSIERQIGNAVPVRMARKIAEQVIGLLPL